MINHKLARLLLPCLGLMLSAPATAQQYPTKPVRIVVGFAPGGSTDNLARVLATRMTELLGQSVIIDNRPGAAGNLAAELVATSIPTATGGAATAWREQCSGFDRLRKEQSGADFLCLVGEWLASASRGGDIQERGGDRRAAHSIQRRWPRDAGTDDKRNTVRIRNHSQCHRPRSGRKAERPRGHLRAPFPGSAGASHHAGGRREGFRGDVLGRPAGAGRHAQARRRSIDASRAISSPAVSGGAAEFGRFMADELQAWGKVVRASGATAD